MPKEEHPEEQGEGGNPGGGNDPVGGDHEDDDPEEEHNVCCAACRNAIAELFSSLDECFHTINAMQQRIEDWERMVEDDFKYLNRNIRKLFGMNKNFKKKEWCTSCIKFH